MSEYGKRVAKKMEDYMGDPNSVGKEINDIQNAIEGVEVRGALAAGVAKSFNKSKWAEEKAIEQTERVDTLIKENPQPSEVVDARGNYPILRDRLNSVDSQLAQTALEIGNKSELPDWLQYSLREVSKMHDDYLRQHAINVRQPPFNAKGNANYFDGQNWYQNRVENEDGTYSYYDLADDDSEAFQAAIDYVYEKDIAGGVIYLPKGNYLIGTPLNTVNGALLDFYGNEVDTAYWAIRNGPIPRIILLGQSRENTHLLAGSTGYIIRPDAGENYNVYYNLELRHIHFVGHQKTGTSVYIDKDLGKPRDVRLIDCSFNNFEHGFRYNRHQGDTSRTEQMRLMMHNCVFGLNKVGAETGGDDTHITESRFEYNDEWGLDISGGTRVNVDNTKIQYNGQADRETGQVKISTGSHSVNFDNCYFEPSFSTNENNRNGNMFLIYKSPQATTSYLNVINFNNSYIHGQGSGLLAIIEDDIIVRQLNLKGSRLRNFRLKAPYELVAISESSTINGLSTDATFVEEIRNEDGTNISNWVFSTSRNIIRNNNLMNENIISTPLTSANGGRIQVISGAVNSSGDTVMFGDYFTVTKNEVGVYKIRLAFKNQGTSTAIARNFPVTVTPDIHSTMGITANIRRVDNQNFEVHMRADDGSKIDRSFSFIAIISRM